MTETERQLQKEREKLDRLIEDAQKKGKLTGEAVLAQSFVVDELIARVIREEEKGG